MTIDEANVALLKAAEEGNLDDVKAAIDAGAYVYIEGKDGCTRLCNALWKGSAAVVELLLSIPGVDVNRPIHRNGLVALELAVKKGMRN